MDRHVTQGGCRCSETSPMMGGTPHGVAAWRTCPSSVTSFGRDPRTRGPRALYEAMRRSLHTSPGRRPGAPKWVPGWCRGRGGAAGGVPGAALRFERPCNPAATSSSSSSTWTCPDPIHRKSDGLSCCAAATCTHSANCADDRRDSSGAVLGPGLTCPLLCNVKCAVLGCQGR